MLAVQQSFHFVNFFEEFQHDEFTYLVTKFVRGGDLLNYLLVHHVDRLEEAHAGQTVRLLLVHEEFSHQDTFCLSRKVFVDQISADQEEVMRNIVDHAR